MPRVPRNPFMSLWLSAAHRMANTGHGMITAEVRRQQCEIVATATRNVEQFWTHALGRTSPPRRPKGR